MAGTESSDQLRKSAHIVVDRLWKGARNRRVMRGISYRYLAHRLKMNPRDFHMHRLSDETLVELIRIARKTTPSQVRLWHAQVMRDAKQRLSTRGSMKQRASKPAEPSDTQARGD